ncbi:hypothetical protein MJO28_009408 [Puccinia striiformis f. sp. tritici]|uniref:Uncharacterized protein n=1 Tax=Puccinia striiformis f. sp. tritici TaxID=168172 RepID=A0ACC0E8N0_9BASI|nr:hypothetical protein MJO28_009408 [Puccinia striiformis f. sp. tritici]
MSAIHTPNHPVILFGHFEPLSPSVPESVRGNQYGFVSTPSYFQCSGIGGNKSDAFEVLLKTNTILTHSLDVGFIYYLSGKLIAMNDGSPPVLTYFESSLAKVGPAGDNQPDFKNKTSVVGLGHVTKREELIGNNDDGGNRLEVEVVHHDWDVQAEIAGNLVDFEVESNTAVVMVNVVSLTSGHSVGRMVQTPLGSEASSPRKGLNFVKRSPMKEKENCETQRAGSSVPLAAQKGPLSEILSSSVCPTQKDSQVPSSPVLGKRVAAVEDAESDNESVKSDAMDVEVEETPKSSTTRTSARKTMLQAAAKRMKRL